MDKQYILDEIRRIADANGGTPPGWRRLLSESGIGYHDWYGKHWARWGDAVREAGYAANELSTAYPDDALLEALVSLLRELGRWPTSAELRLKRRADQAFPSDKVFSRLGPKGEQVRRVLEYCDTHPGHEDVPPLCPTATPVVRAREDRPKTDDYGFVYLMKSGRFYKIGRSNAVGRREREIALQLPEKVQVVHSIRTDDPAGIEAYWHKRFVARRKNAEWFALTTADVAAFRKRSFM